MIWKNTKCELFLKNAQALDVTEQGATLSELVQRLPPTSADFRPLFGAARQVLVLYADRKRYKAHIAAIRDFMLKGNVSCRFDDLKRAEDSEGPSVTQALIQLTNGDGDARSMQLSGYPTEGHYPVCLLLDTDEIDLSRPCQVLAFCMDEPISDIRMPQPEDAKANTDIA